MFVLNVRAVKFSSLKNRVLAILASLVVMLSVFVGYFAMKNSNLAHDLTSKKGVSISKGLRMAFNDAAGDMVTGINIKKVSGKNGVSISWKNVAGSSSIREIYRSSQPILTKTDLAKFAVKVGQVSASRNSFVDVPDSVGTLFYAVVIPNSYGVYPLVPGRNTKVTPLDYSIPSVVSKIEATIGLDGGERDKVVLSWDKPTGKVSELLIYRSKNRLYSAKDLRGAKQIGKISNPKLVVKFVDPLSVKGHYFYGVFSVKGQKKFIRNGNVTMEPATIGYPDKAIPALIPSGFSFKLASVKMSNYETMLLRKLSPLLDSLKDKNKDIKEITIFRGYKYFLSTDRKKVKGDSLKSISFTYDDIGKWFKRGSIRIEDLDSKEHPNSILFMTGLTSGAEDSYSVRVVLDSPNAKSVMGVLLLLAIFAFFAVLLFYVYHRFVGKLSVVFSLVLLIGFSVLGLKILSQDVLNEMFNNKVKLDKFYSLMVNKTIDSGIYSAKKVDLQSFIKELGKNKYNEQIEVFSESGDSVIIGKNGYISLDKKWFMQEQKAVFSFITILAAIFLLLVAVPLNIKASAGFFERFVNAIKNHKTAYLFTAPAVFILTLLVFAPLLYTFVLSTTHIPRSMHIIEADIGRQFIGLSNFGKLLGSFDLTDVTNFYWTLKTTIIYTVITVVIQTILGIILAMFLNKKKLKFRTTFRTLLIIPWAVPTYVSALVWRHLFRDDRLGFVNQIGHILGHDSVNWLGEPTLGLVVIIVASIWYGFPFIMVVALGALQSVPEYLYEAADMEGASVVDRIRHITLPMISPAVMPAIILSSLWTFNNFNFVYLINNSYNGTDILITRIFDFMNPENIRTIDYAMGATFSTVIFFILIIYIVGLRKVTNFTEKNF